MDLSARLKLWKDAVFSPEPTFTAEAKRSVGLVDGLYNYALSTAIYAVISSIVSAVIILLLAVFLSKNALEQLVTLPGSAVIIFVAFIVINFIGAGIYHLIAKALGGKGRFCSLYYTLSLASAPTLAVYSILGAIPCLGVVFGLALWLYQLYLTTLAIQKVHKLSLGRSIAVWAIPLAIVVVILLVLMVVAFALVMAAFASIAHALPSTANIMSG